MQKFTLTFMLLQLIVVVLHPVDGASEARLKGHRLSQRSVRHLRKMGMDNDEIQNLATTMSFKEKGKSKEVTKGEQKDYKCGDALRNLLIRILDNANMDGEEMMTGQLDLEKFSIFSGTDEQQGIPVDKLVFPSETVDDKCFSVKQKGEDKSTIFCTGCTEDRNLWLNALHQKALCKKYNVEGRLPSVPGPELQAEAKQANEAAPSGINIYIPNSPAGKPEVMINGLTVQQMQKLEKKHAVSEVKIKPPTPSISDIAPSIYNEPEEPDNAVNSMNQPKSEAEVDALMESAAEHNAIPASDPRVPRYGYEATKRGLNKHSLNK